MNHSLASSPNPTLTNNTTVDSSNRIRTILMGTGAEHDVNSSPMNQEVDAVDKQISFGFHF